MLSNNNCTMHQQLRSVLQWWAGVKQPAASSDSPGLPSHVPWLPCIIHARCEQSCLNRKICDASPDQTAGVWTDAKKCGFNPDREGTVRISDLALGLCGFFGPISRLVFSDDQKISGLFLGTKVRMRECETVGHLVRTSAYSQDHCRYKINVKMIRLNWRPVNLLILVWVCKTSKRCHSNDDTVQATGNKTIWRIPVSISVDWIIVVMILSELIHWKYRTATKQLTVQPPLVQPRICQTCPQFSRQESV